MTDPFSVADVRSTADAATGVSAGGEPPTPGSVDAGPGVGCDGSWTGARGGWLKSKSLARSAQARGFFAHVGPFVGPPVGRRVQATGRQEIVLDELQIGVVAQLLMVDVAGLRVGADDQPGHAQAVAVCVDVCGGGTWS